MIADFEYYLRDTSRRFAEQYISVDQDWLSGCVEWFLSETPEISNEDLHKSAYEQWLLSDLAESGIECLPQAVQSNSNVFEFTGNYALQMKYLIDIAESAYEQYRNLHDKKLDEAEDEPEQRQRNVSKKKRMLKLELTDGHDTVIAMEHCPIPCLTTKLYPGTKILIKGPMRCVNKVLFLQPANVKILGGEVEKLSIENAYENVLLKAMGRPITSTPKLDYNESIAAEQNRPISNLSSMPVASHNPPTSRNSNLIHDDDDDLFSNLDIDFLNTNVAASHPTQVDQFLDDDDDIFFEANIPDTTVTVPTNPEPNHIAFDDDDDFDPEEIESKIQIDIQNEQDRNLASNNFKELSKAPMILPVTENIDYFDPDLDAMFPSQYSIEDDFANCPRTVSSDITDRNYEFKILGCPLATILQLHSIDDNEKSERSFIVNCEIIKTVGNIQILSNRFHFVVIIVDSSDMQLEVKISNDIVANWADISAEELQKKRSIMKQRPQMKQDIENILHKLTDTVSEFSGFMKIEYSHKNEIPEVTEIIESEANVEEILKKKLAKGS